MEKTFSFKGKLMKTTLWALLAFTMTTSAFASSWQRETNALLRKYKYACRNLDLKVDEIVSDVHIKGHLKGLPQEAIDDFKVIFYVKTDRWYAHPYYQSENPQEGIAYAKINQDGTFQVPTVLRRVPASRLAVSVVPKPYVIKSQRAWLKPFLGLFGGVFKYSCRGITHKLNGEI
jgi:hypothetical protein